MAISSPCLPFPSARYHKINVRKHERALIHCRAAAAATTGSQENDLKAGWLLKAVIFVIC